MISIYSLLMIAIITPFCSEKVTKFFIAPLIITIAIYNLVKKRR